MMKTSADAIRCAQVEIHRVHWHLGGHGDENPEALLQQLDALARAIEDIGFVGSGNLFQCVNSVADILLAATRRAEDRGDLKTAAELYIRVSELYFAASKSLRFRKSAEECRAVASPGNFWSLKAMQAAERSRQVTAVFGQIPGSIGVPAGKRISFTSYNRRLREPYRSAELPFTSQPLYYGSDVRTPYPQKMQFFAMTSLPEKNLFPEDAEGLSQRMRPLALEETWVKPQLPVIKSVLSEDLPRWALGVRVELEEALEGAATPKSLGLYVESGGEGTLKLTQPKELGHEQTRQ